MQSSYMLLQIKFGITVVNRVIFMSIFTRAMNTWKFYYDQPSIDRIYNISISLTIDVMILVNKNEIFGSLYFNQSHQ